MLNGSPKSDYRLSTVEAKVRCVRLHLKKRAQMPASMHPVFPHPDDKGVCDGRAVLTRRVGTADTRLCAPCAVAQGVAEMPH